MAAILRRRELTDAIDNLLQQITEYIGVMDPAVGAISEGVMTHVMVLAALRDRLCDGERVAL